MDKYQESAETWNKVAKLYQEKFMDLDLYNETYNLLCDHLEKQNSKILEIGCGPGNITKYLLNKRLDFKIQGIDLSPNMIELAKKNVPTADFKVMDSRNIHQIEETFDAIIGGFCIPYITSEEVSKLIKDCKKLLSKNGILYLSFVEGKSNQSDFQTSSSGDRVYFHYHEKSKLENDFSKNDFKIIHDIKVDYSKNDGSSETHTILIIKSA